jgi:hypothetical protein
MLVGGSLDRLHVTVLVNVKRGVGVFFNLVGYDCANHSAYAGGGVPTPIWGVGVRWG